MEQLARLQARIDNLHDLRELVGALRGLAASHVQEAQASLAGIRRYVDVVEDAIAEGAALLDGADARSAPPPGDASVLIAVCSEHGFVGAFNERILDRAQAQCDDGQGLAVIGARGAALARERGLRVDRGFAMATHVGGVVSTTRTVAEHLATVATADVVFASYRRGAGFEVVSKRILPLDPALLVRAERRSPPLHHLEPAVLLQRLASEYLFAEVTRAVMESLASENGARLRVMQSADHNIADKLDDLRRVENALRQEAITSELLDVVTGSEAILGSAGR